MSYGRVFATVLLACLLTAAVVAGTTSLPARLLAVIGIPFLALLAERFVLGRRGSVERRRVPKLPAEPSGDASAFLGSISHEIRTPLNGILGLTQLLLKTKTSAQQREYLEMIRSSGDSLLRLINDILEYSQIRAGKLHFEASKFQLRNLIRETIKTMAPQAHVKGVEVAYWIGPDVPHFVVGDPTRLRQVMLNLLGNANKFTDEGEILVEVCLDETDASGTSVRFSVTDSGIGMPESVQREIFEAFTQVHRTSSEQGGVGLGLTISNELVQGMGGRLIEVSSQEGRGSTFRFSVRFEDVQRIKEEPPEGFTGSRALIVDDAPISRDVLARQIESWGVEVEQAGDGETALEAVERSVREDRAFSWLLIDSRMPDTDVWSLATSIQSRSKIPRILMTLSHEHVDGESLRAHGFVGHLGKPIVPSHLARAITIIRRGATVERPEDVQTDSMDRLALGGLRVLLAEDHPVNRMVAVRMLEKSGSRVEAVEDGARALSRLSESRFDLVLLDVQMPEVDGLTVARRIREAETACDERTPIVALTAHAREVDRERCLQAGMDGFLAKPFREEELVTIVKQVFRGSRHRASRQGGSGKPSPSASSRFDRRAALERAGGDPALLAELAALFVADAPRILEAITDALAARNARSVERLSHRLKGSLLTLGASRAAAVALELERAAASGGWRRCGEIFPRLRKEFDELEAKLTAELGENVKGR